jgi:hypothetical protein
MANTIVFLARHSIFWMLTRVSCLLHGCVTKTKIRFSWMTDVNSFSQLGSHGPVYKYEYNTRETYGGSIKNWGPNDPLNATWWHHVTEAMEADASLVNVRTRFICNFLRSLSYIISFFFGLDF